MSKSQKRFINRELSWLSFNERVLAQAENKQVPLLERLRYLCISASNLDEFFEVRVARMKQKIELGVTQPTIDGFTAQETLKSVAQQAHTLVEQQYAILNEQLLPKLRENDIHILMPDEISNDIDQWLHNYFQEHVLPVISPIGLDPTRPFPMILNKSLNYIVRLAGKDAYKRRTRIAVVRAPRSLPRLIRVPKSLASSKNSFIFITTIVKRYINEAFPGMKVESCYQFRTTRNSHLFIDDEEIEDLKEALQGQLAGRGYGDAVRLELGRGCSKPDEKFLAQHFSLSKADIFRADGPVNLNRLNELYDLVDRPDLKFPYFTPSLLALKPEDHDIIDVLKRRDILLHHPYQSFSTVVDWIKEAAADPNVLAIKQTLYRTSSESDIVAALCDAARAGKEVTTIIELRARFDEADNIALADQLQDAGAHVVYGVVGLKTHAKMALVVRREGEDLKRYVHLGTGNYHQRTATAYTDYGLLTANPSLGEDVHRLFLQLSGLGRVEKLELIKQSPFKLHQFMLEMIAREREHAEAGRPARIVARMNSLVESSVINALYKASKAGVEIELIVRGICSLRPGVKGLSENIKVRSIVGRFLEHSRVFMFENGGDYEIFCSSADWMDRNFFRRVEVCFPVLRKKPKQRLRKELEYYLADNQEAWLLGEDGQYEKIVNEKEPFCAQQTLLKSLSATIF